MVNKTDGITTFLELRILQKLECTHNNKQIKDQDVVLNKCLSSLMLIINCTKVISEQVFKLCIKRSAHIVEIIHFPNE